MIFSKAKILTFSALLLFCALTPLASASQNVARFYVKAYLPPENFVGTMHIVDGLTILMGTQSGWVTDAFGNMLGTITVDLLLIIRGIGWSSTGWSTGHFKIVFNNALTVEGMIVTSLVHPTLGTNQFVNGRFTGHGSTNIAGTIDNIEIGSGFAFNGYSW